MHGGVVGLRQVMHTGRRTALERPAKEGDSPVLESRYAGEQDPEYHGARETLWEAGWTTIQG